MTDINNSLTAPESLMERELIVITKPEAGLRATKEQVTSVTGENVTPLVNLLNLENATLEPLFGVSEERLKQEAASLASTTGERVPDLSNHYRVRAGDEQLDELATRLSGLEFVEAAYVKSAAQLAVMLEEAVEKEESVEALNDMMPASSEAPPVTPNYTSRQGYLNSAPEGIDAHYAWTLSGGRGRGVGIIDIEGAWRFTHEDLSQNQGGIVGGTPSTDLGWRNHGTAVIGEFGADVNSFGCTGIAPDANVRGVSIFGGLGSAGAIHQAANLSKPGDIVLIELQRTGPRNRYLPLEFWPDDFAAIRYATVKGVIVVEAAGNGGENLDNPFYNNRPNGFPNSWKNPFNPVNPSSGAVMVGAGAPPPGTHGRDHGSDRSRLSFSNYGARLDVQGWGREVTTCGYGDLQGGGSENLWYTDRFSGTSSASPIVVGALACVQGVLRARRRIPLSPARARQLLRSTGSPQQDTPGRPRTQRIGNRPNLRQLISAALYTREWEGVQFYGTIPAGQTRRWFTYRWPAHWHVVWTVVPMTPNPGNPQIKWEVQVERASDEHITYWISITNVSTAEVNIEARYAVLGW
ncbi:MAG: S8 family peptidase [Pleurocapsa sp. MO_226.B13]|nr:S8 family peptidase [Pleurocapsa sp. MO_226.B13]